MVASTRDRVLDAAMTLFGRHGYRGTSIVAIEEAAGLTPGAGGIYRHFPTKRALLEAGIQRQLERLEALRDLRRLFTGIGDPRAELTLLARYALAELDREADLVSILLVETRGHPELLGPAVNQLVATAYAGFAGWLRERAELAPEQADTVAAVALGALFSSRLPRLLLGHDPVDIDDEAFLDTWASMVLDHTTHPDRAAEPGRDRPTNRS